MKELFKFPVLVFFVFSLFLISCEKDESINEQKLSQNLKQFSEDYLKQTIEIDNEFAKSRTKKLDASFKNTLLQAKTEEDVNISLKNAGILNSDTILKLVINRINLQNNFRTHNPDFYLLDVNKRTSLLNNQYDVVLENYIEKQSYVAKTTSCGSDYNRDISRCNRTFGKCGIVAVIGAAEGLIPGLIIGVFCAWDLSDCKSYALEDYQSCNQ